MASKNDPRPRSRRSIAPIPQTALRNGGDKENLTSGVNAAKQQRNELPPKSGRDKKLRSKSLGPGGLDALKNGNGNRRKSTVPFPLKSILKPAIPVSPIRNIPSFEETRRRTPSRSPQKSSKVGVSNGLLIDFSTPPSVPVVGTENLPNPFDGFNPNPARKDVELFQADQDQRIAKKEKEARESHEREKQAILDQRAARRKSMGTSSPPGLFHLTLHLTNLSFEANRRVSFAPEATLHTWNVVELMEDSTTSSASTNSTRRASALSQSNPSQPPFTIEETSNELEQMSPADQRILHQQDHRRKSGISLAELDNVENDEAFSSSPFSGDSSAEGDETGVASLAPENDGSASDSDIDNESMAMSLDNGTEHSIMSSHSDGSTTDSSSRLERSLRLAAQIAGTNGIEYDENADLSMEYTNHEIAGAFKPWIKKGTDRSGFDAENLSSRFDQENINPFQQSSSKHRTSGVDYDDDDETGMDLTKPVGGILSKQQQAPSEYDSNKIQRTPTSHLDEQTTESAKVVGGIKKTLSPSRELSGESDIAEDEEMTMEFTSVFGGVLNRNVDQQEILSPNKDQLYQSDEQRGDAVYPDLTEVDMEMTGAVGGILPPIEEQTEPLEDETMGMEMTNAIGKILPSLRPTPGTRQDDDLEAEPASSPFQENIMPSPPKPTTPLRVAETPFYDESPILSNIRLKPGRPRSSGVRLSTTPTRQASKQVTPVKRITTPSKQKSPRTIRSTPATPTKTPPSRRSYGSPKKITKPDSQQPKVKLESIFQDDTDKGQSTPKFVLPARKRSPSGLGIDKEGLGSPRVAEILDKRRSIGEDAQAFTPTSRGVRFNDPRELKKGADDGNQQLEQQKTSSMCNLQPGQDDEPNIREMISRLTPKKNKLKGRKSLHVGAGKGLLGKRPIELDIADEDEDNTPKRLRSREASPVKKIKLPAPPSKAETVGKKPRLSLRNTIESPKKARGTTPREAPRFKDVELDDPRDGKSPEFTAGLDTVHDSAGSDPVKLKPLQLSEFLEMTNIHFMELTTTKRRHTLAPDTERKYITQDSGKAVRDISLEDCVAAGFCTIPMLELYQHSCRELKSYISEGRRIIRSIEAETYAENPPLFQEYVTAPPDIRLLMDNQFRNVKAHARLLSKSMWYEWRMKLLEGLKQGLNCHVEEMSQDDEMISKKERLLDGVVPDLIEKHSKLQIDAYNLQKAVEEMENCDQEELKRAREKLAMVDLEVAKRKVDLEEAQSNLEEYSKFVKTGIEQKTRLLSEIQEAEGVLEECRGCTEKAVSKFKTAVQNLEKTTGWAIISANSISSSNSNYGPVLSMRYSGELRLDFHPAMFHSQSLSGSQQSQHSQNLPIKLSYAPESTRGSNKGSVNPTPEIELMLHALRTRIAQLTQPSISPKTFLSSISQTWDTLSSIRHEIRMLAYCGVTTSKTIGVTPSEPALLKVRCILLGFRTEPKRHKKSPSVQIAATGDKKSKARLDIDFTIKPRPVVGQRRGEEPGIGIVVDVDVSAGKIYGFSNDNSSDMSEQRIGEFVTQLIQRQDGKGKQFGKGLWKDAVKELERKVLC
ncbi:hypothetical protein PRK78_005140 [Emydomyces testavorans]|uniref:Spc7 kinetochore protein domain-containing protein n=1 Tax=Emydomyces testavorans TaxID=2070801 RepID=A0AAF0DLH6_9EURO|nr:hypothetical protein PRK78_005140 [Emydomyces testavorans]